MILDDSNVYEASFRIEHGLGLDKNIVRTETVRIVAKSDAEALLEALHYAHTAARFYRPRCAGKERTTEVSLTLLCNKDGIIDLSAKLDGIISDLQAEREKIKDGVYVTDNMARTTHL